MSHPTKKQLSARLQGFSFNELGELWGATHRASQRNMNTSRGGVAARVKTGKRLNLLSKTITELRGAMLGNKLKK